MLRILDSKSPLDTGLLNSPAAPVLTDFLSPAACDRAEATIEAVTTVVSELSSTFRVTVNPRLVRGLDYYTDTVFEFTPLHPGGTATHGIAGIGAQGTVLAGGSYGNLVSSLGGPDHVVGVGWSAGLDRLALLLVRTTPVMANWLNASWAINTVRKLGTSRCRSMPYDRPRATAPSHFVSTQ